MEFSNILLITMIATIVTGYIFQKTFSAKLPNKKSIYFYLVSYLVCSAIVGFIKMEIPISICWFKKEPKPLNTDQYIDGSFVKNIYLLILYSSIYLISFSIVLFYILKKTDKKNNELNELLKKKIE